MGYSDMADTVDIHDPKNVIMSSIPFDQVTWNASFTDSTAMLKVGVLYKFLKKYHNPFGCIRNYILSCY